MSLETRLGTLKEEIIDKHHEIESGAENNIEVQAELAQKIQEYEAISAAYSDLFKKILEDGLKMKEGYNKERKKQDNE